MLSRKERLSREEFNRFFSTGKRLNSPSLYILYTPRQTLHASVVVSKKNVRNAVDRNKIRRRVYDIVRRYKAELGITGVYIIVTKPEVKKLSYEKMKEEVYEVLTKALRT